MKNSKKNFVYVIGCLFFCLIKVYDRYIDLKFCSKDFYEKRKVKKLNELIVNFRR